MADVNVRLVTGRDQTAAINDQIRASQVGDRLHFPSGSYQVDGRVQILSGREYIGPDDGSFCITTAVTGTPRGTRSFRSHWTLSGARDVVLRHLGVRGPNRTPDATYGGRYSVDWEAEHGFCVRADCENVLIEDCRVEQVYGDGVYVGQALEGNRVVEIVRFRSAYTGRHGVGIVHAYGVSVRDFEVLQCRWSAVDIEPIGYDEYVHDVLIENGRFGSRYYPVAIGGVGGTGTGTERRARIAVLGNTVVACPSNHCTVLAVPDGPSRDLTIARNVDLRQPTPTAFNLSSTWRGRVVLEANNVRVKRTVFKPAQLARVAAPDELVIRNHALPTAQRLASLVVKPRSYVHCGNTWASGSDGACP